MRFRAEQHFEALLQLLHARCERDLPHVGFHIERCERQVVLGCKGPQQLLLDGLLSHQQVDLHRALLSHPVSARDALFQDGRIPWQIHVDDRVRRLEVESCGTAM